MLQGGFIFLDTSTFAMGLLAQGELFISLIRSCVTVGFIKFYNTHIISFAILKVNKSEYIKVQKQLTGMQAQLEHLEKLSSLGVMAAGMAHELNNPLTVIKGNIDIFSVMPLERIRERLPTITAQVERMVEIVDHLRNFSRKESKLDWKVQHISDSIKNAVLLHRHNIRNIKIDLRMNIDEEAYIYGGEHQLESVWQNLIGNSCDAFGLNSNSTKNNRISIHVSLSGDRVILVYRDNAGGMSTETLEKIFDPFYTTKELGKGTGLGMAIAYGIIHEHKGIITVDSVYGQGTVFTVDLPKRLADLGSNLNKKEKENLNVINFDEKKKALEDSFTGSNKILVVDDEPGILEFLSIALGEAYEVETALSGSEALSKLEHEQFLGMLVDVNMPVMKGDELAKLAREKKPELKVVFMSAHALDVIESDLGIYLGASKLIPKPFKSPVDVLKVVISSLEEEDSTSKKAS